MTWARTAVSWARSRPTATAALVYAVLAFAIFAPGFAPGRTLSASDFLWTATPWDSTRPAHVPGLGSNRELLDATSVFQPAIEHNRAVLPHIPLWDPHMMSGRPYLADPQSEVFSPFSLPSYVLPFWTSLAFVAAIKLLVAALGAFLLARAIGMRFGGAFLTGLVFGFSLWEVTWVSWTLGSVWTFLPWVCLLCEQCVRRPGPLPWAGLATITGLQWLGGHPSSSFQVLVIATLFWLGLAVASPPLRERLPLRVLTLGSALLVGTALAGVMLIPFAEMLAHSTDAGTRTDISQVLFRQPPRYLLGIFLHDWWGSGRTSLEFAATTQEHAYYVGALPLMLAAFALVLGSRRERIAVAVVVVAALSVATGSGPLFDLVVKLPGFAAANNSRFAVFAALGLAVLAGWGLDDLTARRLPARRGELLLALAVVLLALPVVIVTAGHDINLHVLRPALRAAWGFHTPTLGPEGVDVVRLASLLEWAVVAAAALILVVLRLRRRLSGPAFVALAAVLVALDLLKAGAGYNTVIRQADAVQPATPAIRYLQAQLPGRFVGLAPTAPASLSPPLPPNLAVRYGLYDARGYIIPSEERNVELWRRAIANTRNCYSFFCTVAATTTPESLQALGVLGVGSLLQNQRDDPLPGLTPVYTGPDARIYRNPRALPRAFLVARQVVRPEARAQLAAVTSVGFPLRSAAVTEERLPGLAEGTGKSAESPGRARLVSYRAERVEVKTYGRGPRLLVLTDTWYPGWKAKVDGKDAPIDRVDYLIRGVRLPAGAHRVEFRYEPASWRAGWIVSTAALLMIAAAAGIGYRRRPQRT